MLEDIGLMIDQYRAHDGTISGLSIVVSTDSAVALLQEVFYRKHARVEFTDDPDELFLFDGIPVRLRVRSTPGVAILVKNTDIPPRSCCDATATTTIAISMSWRKS